MIAAAITRKPNLQVTTSYERRAGGLEGWDGCCAFARIGAQRDRSLHVRPAALHAGAVDGAAGRRRAAARLHREVFGPEALEHIL